MEQSQGVCASLQDLLRSIAEARSLTDKLFSVVRPESLYERTISERHRIIFYLGHLEVFDWNLLGLRALGLSSFHKDFDQLFAFGIDPVDGGLPTDLPSDWPSAEQVRAYNQQARRTLDAALEKISVSGSDQPLLRDGLGLHVAREHRLMHTETLAYMFHQLPAEHKVRQSTLPAPAARPMTPRMAEIPAGTATLGLPRRGGGVFGWDNEFEEHPASVAEFAMDVHKVTNGQYLEFMAAGGYLERTLWNEPDWEWREKQGIHHPTFWARRGERWFYRGMFEEIPLPRDWPVYVSHAEASAYARWIGKSLPTEAQWHRAATGAPDGSERAYPWGDRLPETRHGNFNSDRGEPAPVGAYPSGTSAFGVADLLGNGWEWTSTLFSPFPGFQPFPFYPGYSANFFDGKHYVLKGGSPRTAPCLLRRSFRNWFQPHYQYLYAGFRCARDGA